MAYDDLLRKVSGRNFERKMFTLFFLNGIPNALLCQTLTLILYLPDDYHCAIPDLATKFMLEFDLSCEQSSFKPVIVAMFFIGVSVATSLGYLSDRFGRRPMYVIFTFAQFIAFFLQSFSHTAWMYALTLFLAGFTHMVNYMSGFVLGAELTVPEKRNYISIPSFVSYSIGFGIGTFFFYLSPDWRWALRVYSMVGFLYIPYIWLIPESPRWLMANGRVEDAKEVLKVIAKSNNKSDSYVEAILEEVEKEAEELMHETSQKKRKSITSSQRVIISTMIKIPRVMVIFLVLAFSWLSIALVYFGISLNVQSLSGNIFFNNTLMGLVEIPGYILAYLAVNYMSRPISHGSFMIGSGVCCMGAALLDSISPLASTVVALMGKGFNCGAFYIVFIHTAEAFPTLLRNSFMSAGSFAGRLGSIVSPYVVYMVELYGMYSPFILMSSLTISSGVMTLLLLPETHNKPLPETVDDMLEIKTICSAWCGRGSIPDTEEYSEENRSQDKDNPTNFKI